MKTMTSDDFKWLMSLVEDGNVCTECDIFDKCQEENRDYCEDKSYGRPCVRALNIQCREEKKKIDYTNYDFKEVWFM